MGSVRAHRNCDSSAGNSLSARRSRRGPELADGAGINERRWFRNGLAFFSGMVRRAEARNALGKRSLAEFICVQVSVCILPRIWNE